MKLFLGIDGGGSQTRAAVVSDSLEVLGQGQSGPSNHYVVGAERASEHCEAAAIEAIADATRLVPKLSRDDISGWGFGLAGVKRTEDAAKVWPHLANLAGGLPWVLDTDAAAAHAGAFQNGPGIVLSAGTGAICYGDDGHGARVYADGWGPLLGDEGGGYWIGMEALKAVCRATDGRGPKTRLSAPILSALRLRDVDELVMKLYGGELDRGDIANLTREVFDAADNGVQVAVGIRDEAVERLSSSVTATARVLLEGAQNRAVTGSLATTLDVPVALRGGLFHNDGFRASVGYAVGEQLIGLKRDFLPLGAWKIVRPQFDAAVGAALLVQKSIAKSS